MFKFDRFFQSFSTNKTLEMCLVHDKEDYKILLRFHEQFFRSME